MNYFYLGLWVTIRWILTDKQHWSSYFMLLHAHVIHAILVYNLYICTCACMNILHYTLYFHNVDPFKNNLFNLPTYVPNANNVIHSSSQAAFHAWPYSAWYDRSSRIKVREIRIVSHTLSMSYISETHTLKPLWIQTPVIATIHASKVTGDKLCRICMFVVICDVHSSST